MKKVLWLASWYPNKLSPLNGDFIKRHAEAVSIFQPVQVLYLIKDTNGVVTDHRAIENYSRGNLCETIGYYKPKSCGIKSLDRIISMLTYLMILRQMVTSFISSEGRPALVHVHVTMWAGLMALWLKKKMGIPYLVTEHWSGYETIAAENIYTKGLLFRALSRAVITNAVLVLPVTGKLGALISRAMGPIKFEPISNVVDTSCFNYRNAAADEFRFIHVSSMGSPKNMEGMLAGFSMLLQSNRNWKLVLAGPAPERIKNLIYSLGLEAFVTLTGEVTYQQVAEYMSASMVLVMFSKHENQPCAILEALCCGLPVIATDVGGIPDEINATNGLLVPSGDKSQLVEALIFMMEHYSSFDRIRISEEASGKYNYNTIGRKISEIYKLFAPVQSGS